MGTQVAFVHMGSEEQAKPFFAGYGLEAVPRISDPDRNLYKAFGLARGGVMQLVGPAVWARGVAAFAKGYGVGAVIGDPRQMAGVFLVHQEQILKAFRHETSGDVPDYEELATCPLPGRG
jgi:hypothetical protein